jgi:hypothetical protein
MSSARKHRLEALHLAASVDKSSASPARRVRQDGNIERWIAGAATICDTIWSQPPTVSALVPYFALKGAITASRKFNS